MKIISNYPLGNNSGYKCGSYAEKLYLLSSQKDLYDLYSKESLKPFYPVIGGGYNTLISSLPVKEPVVKLSGAFEEIKSEGEYLKAGAAAAIGDLLKKARENSLSGLEFMTGIPGTVGAALYGNAGGKDNYISDRLTSLTVFDCKENTSFDLRREEIEFGYRRSGLSRSQIITSAVFKLEKKHLEEIIRAERNILEHKKDTQPLGEWSCGCVFKNPAGQAAGELIERAGFKGYVSGGAQISTKHANFIVNNADAVPEDIWKLIKTVREKVKKLYNIDLELEIEIIGEGFD